MYCFLRNFFVGCCPKVSGEDLFTRVFVFILAKRLVQTKLVLEAFLCSSEIHGFANTRRGIVRTVSKSLSPKGEP